MKSMKNLMMYAMGALVLPFLASCSSDDDKGYAGENKIYLSVEGDPVIDEAEATPLVVNVDLTTALEQAATLEFTVQDDAQGVLKLEDNPVTIPAGSRTASFKVVSNQLSVLEEDTYFYIGLKSTSDESLKLNETLRVRVTPALDVPVLTDAQKALIEQYNTQYGIDLNDWIGIVSCRVTVQTDPTDADGSARSGEFEGKTVITLSEASETAGKPVLKMVSNPMGLTEYVAGVLRRETVENTYWYDDSSTGGAANEYYAKSLELFGWSKENPGTFTMSLDNLVLNIADQQATVDFVGENEDEMSIIPFDYTFSPWAKQQELIAENNTDATELEDMDGTANPAYYLQYYSVTEDEVGESEYFVEPSGTIDFAAKTMKYEFVFSGQLDSNYSHITVTYEKK